MFYLPFSKEVPWVQFDFVNIGSSLFLFSSEYDWVVILVNLLMGAVLILEISKQRTKQDKITFHAFN